jgi:hypothetical protein
MSNTKLTFARSPNGGFDFSEPRLSRLTTALRERVGQQGPHLPESFMRAASAELVRAIHKAADERRVAFGDAARRVIVDRPELFWLTRGLAVPDHDGNADVEIEER